MSKIDNFIQDYKFGTNLIFVGNPGVGKTHIMKKLYSKLPKNEGTLVKYWLDDGQFREFITSGNMSLRKPEDFKASVTNYPLNMCIRVKILFFDDIGASGNVSEAQKTKLKFILDEREKKGLVNIFSTNLLQDEISTLYGKRIKSRVYNGKHPMGLQIISLPGEDRRKENIDHIQL